MATGAPGRPKSPWARRFPFWRLESTKRFIPSSILDSPNREHSGAAIEYPRRDPKYYNDPLPEMLGLERPWEGRDFDRLFYCEQLQTQRLYGPKIWEVASLNRWIWFSSQIGLVSGGHLRRDAESADVFRQLFEDSIIHVDGTQWFPFWRKERWYDLSSDPALTQPSTRGGTWSVDEPKVWDALKICLELADRILKALIKDRHSWLDMLFFGRIEYWKDIGPHQDSAPFPEARVLLTPQMEATIAQAENKKPWKHPATDYTNDRMEELMNERLEKYTRNLIWSFLTDDRPGSIYGLTMAWPGRIDGQVIVLSLESLRLLIEGDITLAERCLTQMATSVTILHELMHAIMMARQFDEQPLIELGGSPGAEPGVDPVNEPFIDFQPIAEIGQAMETALFGGALAVHPTPHSIPLCGSVWEWPNPVSNPSRRNANDPMYTAAHMMKSEQTTAMVAARLFSVEFWNDESLAKKSDRFFYSSGIFKSTSNCWPSFPTYGAPITWGEITVDESQKHNWRPGDAELVEAWRERQRIWKQYREDWYDVHHARWSSTAWSFRRYRHVMDVFNDSFKATDEILGSRCGMAMGVGAVGAPLDWRNAAAFMNNLPSPTNRSNDWIFFTLGLLMSAAMPVQYLSTSEGRPTLYQWYLTPSSKARDTMNANADHEDTSQMPREVRLYVNVDPGPKRVPNILFDPFRGDMELVMNPVQIEYIRVAFKILKHLKETRAVVSRSWFYEIYTLIQRLYDERVQLSNSSPQTHTSMWVSEWGFRIPEYPHEGSDWMQWDPERQNWGLVP